MPNMSTNSTYGNSNPVRANPYTGKSVTPTSSIGGNLGGNSGNTGHTDFGPPAGTFKPINPGMDLGNELRQNSKTTGSYGNYGQKTNPFNEPNPFAIQKSNNSSNPQNLQNPNGSSPNSGNFNSNFQPNNQSPGGFGSSNPNTNSQNYPNNSSFTPKNQANSNNSINIPASSSGLVSSFGANSGFSPNNNPNNSFNSTPNYQFSSQSISNSSPNSDNFQTNLPNFKGSFAPNQAQIFPQNSTQTSPQSSYPKSFPNQTLTNNSNFQNQGQNLNFQPNFDQKQQNNLSNQNVNQNNNQSFRSNLPIPIKNSNQNSNFQQNQIFNSNQNSPINQPNSNNFAPNIANQNSNFQQNSQNPNSQNTNRFSVFPSNFQPNLDQNQGQNNIPNNSPNNSISENKQNFQNSQQIIQINQPQNPQNKTKSSGLFGLFGQKPEKVVVQQVLSKDSVEYLKQLNPSDLRKEVIKTEIEIQKALIENERAYRDGISTVRDLISPSGVKITHSHLELNTKLTRSFFILVYPRVINMGWLEGLVNADLQMDISIFIYPRDSADVLRDLKGKVAKIQASLQINAEQGKTRDPALETAYRDVEGLRDAIQQGVEKFFRTGVYITVYGDTLDQLEKNSQAVEGVLSQQSIVLKRASLQMDDGFNASLPILKDDLDVVSNMNTGPLSACFPFVSSDLSSDSGILYGINRHNSSLIIFDRFELENANSLVFATSGAGKSYTVKLEILRSLMLGVGVIVIDPEQEYKVLADTLGGTYINMSLNSNNRINPFDLPKPLPGESTADIIRTAIIDLMGLMNLMMGKMSATEIGIMERAIKECYNKRDITDNSDLTKVQAPTMTDLVEILQGIVGGDSLAQRLYRYTEGTFSGLFNKPTNINMKNDFIVFNIRDLQDTLRPIAMYILLKYVWTEIRTSLKKRILAIDEAWIMMQYEDSARFLFSLAKRARKYYLGITTITQDVGDFLNSPLGKPIVTNAAMKMLLKQSTAAIDGVGETFALTSGEKQVLLQSDVGQGIFFAGARHVAIEIIAFPTEHRLITTNPKDLLKIQEQDAGKN